MYRYRDAWFDRVIAPEGEILSFASPKESIQRKGDPDAAWITRHIHVPCPSGAMHANRLSCRFVLRSSLSTGVAERGSCPFVNVRHLCRTLFPPKAPVLGAAYGIVSFSLAKWECHKLDKPRRVRTAHILCYANYLSLTHVEQLSTKQRAGYNACMSRTIGF
jgi:hypothetical protein